MPEQPFRYQGFSRPNYTQVPDDVFDVLLPELTESELKVLLSIIRRTVGFKKDADTISLKQMVEGIRTRDGQQLDRGAGISKTSAVRGVTGLVEKGIIVAGREWPAWSEMGPGAELAARRSDGDRSAFSRRSVRVSRMQTGSWQGSGDRVVGAG